MLFCHSERSRGISVRNPRYLRGILRLRYAPLRMTQGYELQAKNLAAAQREIPR
jgi:hypothetical protein